MCRLFMADRESIDWLVMRGDSDFLSPYLAQLEKSNGGHGNGVAALIDRKPIYRKGLALTAQDAAEWLLDAYLDGATSFLFHTRLASWGSISKENCHPFIAGSGKRPTLLAHNGHDTSMIDRACVLGYHATGKPDTDAGAYIAHMLGPQYLKRYSGNFLGYYRGRPFQVIGHGGWSMHKIKAGLGTIYCSELPLHLKKTCYTSENLNPVLQWKTLTHLEWSNGCVLDAETVEPPDLPTREKVRSWMLSDEDFVAWYEKNHPDEFKTEKNPD